MPIRLKRIYEAPAKADGYRVLVDRMWPRGISKDDAKVDLWLKEIAPSSELRKWFAHDPEKWDEFKRRYFRELEGHPQNCNQLAGKATKSTVTLLFAAKDVQFNNAAALKEYLEQSSGN
ncbi:DUF488 domain-containing protein [soil metagenome]